MRLGQPYVQGHDAGLGTKTEQRQPERDRSPKRVQVLRPHIGEGVVAGVRLQHAKTQQQADRADMGDQQVEVPGLANFGDAMVGNHQEERRQGHRLPHHHEGISVVGQHHHHHRRKKDVVFEAEQARRRSLTLAKITGGESGYPGGCARDHEQEKRAQGVEPQMKRQ